MTDLISRKAALDIVFDFAEMPHRMYQQIRELPTIEPKNGKWIYHEPLDVFECSVCGRQMVRNIFNYCPWCGAKMERREDERTCD